LFVQILTKTLKAILPEGSVKIRPIMNGLQGLKSRTVEPLSAMRLALDKSDFTQDAEMLRNSRIADPQLIDAIANGLFLVGKKREQRPAIGVRNGLKNV
jgi:hypothetical protein